MDFGTVLIVAAVLAALIMAGGIIDIVRLGGDRFAAAGKRRWQWILLIVYCGPLGVLLYAAAARPQIAHPERYADDPGTAAALVHEEELVGTSGTAAVGGQSG